MIKATAMTVDPHKNTPGLDSISNELSSRRTGMSFQRTRMSADRTLMSVIRTSLSLISFGFTIFQLFLKLADSNVLKEGTGVMRSFGASLVVLGILMLLSGIGYHSAFMLELRRQRKQLVADGLIHGESKFPVSFTLIVAILLLLLGLYAIAIIMGIIK